MDSQTYWKNREAEQRKHNIRDEAEYQKHIREIYQNMIDEIEKEINGFYGKYAKKEASPLQRPGSVLLKLISRHWTQGCQVCEGEEFLPAGK